MTTEFDETKYRSIDFEKKGELKEVRKKVLSDQHFIPNYHVYPKTGLLNDPNGLVFDGEEFHIFYQWYPYSAMHGMKHWFHLTTKDFITFEEKEWLKPDQYFESHGCYSGGALHINGQIYCFYTGNTRLPDTFGRKSYQNIAIYNKKRDAFQDKFIMTETPEGFEEEFRDPNPWLEGEHVNFVCGAKRLDGKGTATLFTYNPDKNDTKFVGELSVKGFNNEDIFMWECPDLTRIGDQDLFIWSPQGLKEDAERFHNIYNSVYALGEIKDHELQTVVWDELDRGFDFYAPQTIKQSESTIMIGWIGLPEATYPSDAYDWQGMLTLPRVLEVRNNTLYQKPHPSIYSLTKEGSKEAIKINESYEPTNQLSTSLIKIRVHESDFNIQLFNEDEQMIVLTYVSGTFTIDRSKTDLTEFMKEYGNKREVKVPNLSNLELFIDQSVIEIYLNDGEFVLTTRFFIENRKNCLFVEGDVEGTIYEMDSIKLW